MAARRSAAAAIDTAVTDTVPESASAPWARKDLRVEICDLGTMAQHEVAWADLATRCLEANPFMDPGFCLSAARHLVPPGTVEFLLVWAPSGDSRLLAVCPIARPVVPGWPIATVWFHDLSALGALMLCRDNAGPALEALMGALARRRPGRAALGMTALDRDGPTARLLERWSRDTGRAYRFLDPRARAALSGPAGAMPAGLAALSARRAKELQRQRRRLAERGALRYEVADDPAALRKALDSFLALEREGWKGRAGTALAAGDRTAAFVRAMVEAMAAEGRCRIDALCLDGMPIAMGIVLSGLDRDFFWKTAFAESHAGLSPGVQFVLDLTRRQQERAGVALTDSCAVPDHPMIDRLWPARLEIADAMIAIRPGRMIAFRWSVGMERVRRGVRAAAKRLYLRLRHK